MPSTRVVNTIYCGSRARQLAERSISSRLVTIPLGHLMKDLQLLPLLHVLAGGNARRHKEFPSSPCLLAFMNV